MLQPGTAIKQNPVTGATRYDYSHMLHPDLHGTGWRMTLETHPKAKLWSVQVHNGNEPVGSAHGHWGVGADGVYLTPDFIQSKGWKEYNVPKSMYEAFLTHGRQVLGATHFQHGEPALAAIYRGIALPHGLTHLAKAEDLGKMALKDYPAAAQLPDGTFDYSHFLPEDFKGKLQLVVKEGKDHAGMAWRQELRAHIKRLDRQPHPSFTAEDGEEEAGAPLYLAYRNSNGTLKVDQMFSRGYQGRHIGRAALKALQAHALRGRPEIQVTGQTASPGAIRTHNAVAAEEGFEEPFWGPSNRYFYTAKSELAKAEDDPYQYDGWGESQGTHWRRRAFGAVVFNDQGQVLIRKPSGGFGGYTWTWPKGKMDHETEHPLKVAHREVHEETGHKGVVMGFVPGTFRSDSDATNNFFLMRHDGAPPVDTDWETEEVRWAHPTEARKLLAMSPNTAGAKRDVAILDAAVKHMGVAKSEGESSPWTEISHRDLAQFWYAHEEDDVSQDVAHHFKRFYNGQPQKMFFGRISDPKLLQPWLQDKLDKEGEPNWEAVECFENQEIRNPVIVDQSKGFTVTGRHRLAAALKYGKSCPVVLIAGEHAKSAPWLNDLRKDMADFKQIGDNLGSNDGGTFVHPQTGEKYYFKFQPSNDHAKNEILAHKLYQAAGVQSLDMRPLKMEGGRMGTGSKWVATDALDDENPEHRQMNRKLFALHAWLGNWDHHVYGNMGLRNGKVAAMDLGGALLFRARGEPKPNFGNSVDEWHSLREYDHAGYFDDMSPKELRESAGLVSAVTDDQIDALVKQHGPGTDTQKGRLAAILKARRQDVMRRAGLGI